MNQRLFLLLFFSSSLALGQTVSNVIARPEGEQVIISYDLAGNAGESYEVKVTCSKDGGKTFTIIPNSLNGAVNRWEAPGTSKVITWAAKKDLGEFEGDLQFKVIATGKGGATVTAQKTSTSTSSGSNAGSATAETNELSFTITSVFSVPDGFKILYKIKAKSEIDLGILNSTTAQDHFGNVYIVTSAEIDGVNVLNSKTRKFIVSARKDGEMILKISKMNSATLNGRILQSLSLDTNIGSLQLMNIPRM